MRLGIPERLHVVIAVIALAIALPAIAQKVRVPTLVENPYRDIGGSCVYGRQGELVYAPKGASCGSRRDEEDSPSQTTTPDRWENLAPALRAEMVALFEGHSHVAEELTRLRRAIAVGRTDDALQATDHVVQELTEQLAREERLLEKLLQGSPANGS